MALYDAFISYSHAKDKPVAAALQSAIQKLGKPWYRRRALRLFRDDTSLTATPHLWPTIEQALGQSGYFLLLASPEAAASKWVNKEVGYWLEHNSSDTLLIGLTDGELVWNDSAGDFFAGKNMPLPPALAKRFPTEPKWVDLRPYREGANRAASKRDAKFTELAADFAAAIRGMPKEDLLSQEVRQQRRALTLAWSAVAALLALFGLAGWQWYQTSMQRDRAEKALVRAENTVALIMLDFDLVYQEYGRSSKGSSIWGQAITMLNRVIEIRPTARAYSLRGTAYGHKGDFEHAIADFDQVIALDPKSAGAYEGRGRVYLEKGDFDHAIADFDQAIALDPKNERSFRERGGIYRDKGDLDHAIADFDQAIALDPKNAINHESRGAAYGVKGDLDHAIAEFDQAIAIDPKYKLAYYDRGVAYRDKGDLDRAIAELNQAIARDARYATAYSFRCWLQAVIGRELQQALLDCSVSLSLRPNNADTLESRGFTYLKLGQFSKAIADYTAALKRNPKSADSLYGRAIAELKEGDTAAGNTDMAAAKAIQADIADTMAAIGVMM
jgi:tetratricopeptide (TPR) repeat protein